MIRKMFRVFNFLKLKTKNDRMKSGDNSCKYKSIPKSIQAVKKELLQVFSDCNDFVLREVSLGKPQIKLIIAFLEGLVSKQQVSADVLKAIMIESGKINNSSDLKEENVINILKEKILSISELAETKDFNRAVGDILSGNTVIFTDRTETALSAFTKGWESRKVEEPDTESVVRGPREGFVETLEKNVSLIRRKVKNANLKFEIMKLGEQTNTDVCICYIKGIVNESVLAAVRRRLKKIKTDAILESGYIEEFIEDAPFSLFPTVGNSEKPDIVAAKILEGRVAVLCDGTPFVLTVPYLFIESFQAGEDYYSRSYFSSFLRILRIIAFFISTTLPAFYVALISFHQAVIPFELLLNIAASREGVPFSPLLEALLMGISFEFLREAGVRMPRPIGQAVSIVGALVLGESAVRAGLASNIMVIITALTAICSFITPPMGGTILFLRLINLFSASILGFLGLTLTICVFVIHLCTIRSYGVPYMAPFSPLYGMDLKDTLVRVPVWAMLTRPAALKNTGENKYRMKINYRKKED